jgi:hypothetical protein
MDTYEEMSRERYEAKRDAGAPRCRKCHQSENQVVLVCCAVRTCGEFLCERCATETEWELEGCCDEHAAAMASRLRQRLSAAESALRTQAERAA